MLGTKSLCAGRNLFRTTPAVTRGLGFSGLIRRTAPFSRFLWHTRGCGESILIRILTGLANEGLKIQDYLDAQGLWAGRDLYRATPAVTQDLVFFRSHPKDRPIESPFTTHEGMWRITSNPDPHGYLMKWDQYQFKNCWKEEHFPYKRCMF
jgi:hypothetical protein